MLIERVGELTGRSPEAFMPIVVEGTPHSAIVDQAEKLAASLIVVGGHGHGARDDVTLGSVAERVLRYAHCAVLVARDSKPGARILVATDLSDPSVPALAEAAREAARSGSEVTALHCFETVTPIAGPEYGVVFAPVLPPELAAEARNDARARLDQAAQQVGLRAELRVADGAPAATIVKAAQTLDAGLLVIGTHGRTGLRRVVLGSVAETIARTATCSLLVVRLSEPS
jgi:nucleotide-binding universal stress UspA family protein